MGSRSGACYCLPAFSYGEVSQKFVRSTKRRTNGLAEAVSPGTTGDAHRGKVPIITDEQFRKMNEFSLR